MRFLKKFNESGINFFKEHGLTHNREIKRLVKGNWTDKENIGEIDEESVKKVIDDYSYRSLQGRPAILFFLDYSFRFGRLNLVKYIFSEYVDGIPRRDILYYIDNTIDHIVGNYGFVSDMSDDLKAKSLFLLRRYREIYR